MRHLLHLLLLHFLLFTFAFPAFAQEETLPPLPVTTLIYLLPHVEDNRLVGVLAVTQVDAHDYLGVYYPADPESLYASSTLATLGNWLETFTYDTLGNLTNKSDLGNYSYSGTGYLNPHAATQIGGTNYTYDNAGNLLTGGNGTATTTNTWNYRNRLTDTNDGKGSSATTTHYAYDESDQRVQMDVKKGSAATTTTKYFSPQYEVTTQSANSTTTMYITLPDGTPLAIVEGTGNSTTTSVIHTDHLGGTNVVSTESGSQRQLVNYYPYGDLRQNEQPASGFDDKRKAIGQHYDDATSLNYFNARYYQGQNGKFLSQDPVARDIAIMPNMAGYILDVNQPVGEFNQTALLSSPQLLNSYSYAGNNPITKSDPSGKCVDGVTTIACVAAYTLLTTIIAGNGLMLYGAIADNPQAIEAGFALNDAGTIGGSGMAQSAGMTNPITGVKGGTKLPAATSKTNSSQNGTKSGGVDFVVDPSGQAFPVPKGAAGPTPTTNKSGNVTGAAFTGGFGGQNGQVSTMRMMNSTPMYPNGYIKYENSNKQGVDPYTGKTGSQSQTHYPINTK